MTPKEFNFLCQTLEEASAQAYVYGYEECEKHKPMNAQQFRLTEGNKLVLKKEINKLSKTR